MINFFTPAPRDASLEYLGKIFGNVNGVIPTGGDITILGTMFSTFNSIILAVGALIIVYTTVVGVMMTAHEGEFMKKWNSLWTPIRAVIGIASLFPTATGYSVIQIIMMWVIVQGLGAADTLWTTALGYANTMGSPFAQASVPTTGVAGTVADLFKAVTCDQTARATYENPYGASTGGYFCNSGDPWCSSSPTNIDPAQTSEKTFSFGPQGSCGKVNYCSQAKDCSDPASLKCQACKIQVESLSGLISLLRGVASIYVQEDYLYQNYYANGYTTATQRDTSVVQPPWVKAFCDAKGIAPNLCRGPAPLLAFGGLGAATKVPGGLPDPSSGQGSASKDVVSDVYWPYAISPKVNGTNVVSTAIDQYQYALKSVAQAFIDKMRQEMSTQVFSAQYEEARQVGWLYAGAYYYTLAQNNSANIKESFPALSVAAADPATGTSGNTNQMKTYRNNFEATGALIKAMAGGAATLGGVDTDSLAEGTTAVSGAMLMSTNPDSGANPLISFATAGYILLIGAQLLYIGFLAVAAGVGLASGINAMFMGTGGFNPMAISTPLIYMVLVPVFLALMGLMVTLGATMGVYVPLIPFMIFTFGAIGWFTSVIEAMVAGPLVALGILAPGGHHEIMGKAEPALMLLFNVFLRPSLMIFGLVAAMLLANVVVSMINNVFWTLVVVQITGSATGSLDTTTKNLSAGNVASLANPLLMIFFLVAYVGIVISALNKCFAVIHLVPEKVMRWIGGQGESYGEGESLGEMRRGVEGAGGSAKGAMASGPKTIATARNVKAKSEADNQGKGEGKLDKHK